MKLSHRSIPAMLSTMVSLNAILLIGIINTPQAECLSVTWGTTGGDGSAPIDNLTPVLNSNKPPAPVVSPIWYPPKKKPTTTSSIWVKSPTLSPSNEPTTAEPSTAGPTSAKPTKLPTSEPSTSNPTNEPTDGPTSTEPTKLPTSKPSTAIPTKVPTNEPSNEPTTKPTNKPTITFAAPTKQIITNAPISIDVFPLPPWEIVNDKGDALQATLELFNKDAAMQPPPKVQPSSPAVSPIIENDDESVVVIKVDSEYDDDDQLQQFSVDDDDFEQQGKMNASIDDSPIQAVGDKATTFTNQPIVVDVLQNDYVQDDDVDDGGGSKDTGIVVVLGEQQNLVLDGIVSNGINGECTIITDDNDKKVLYTPDEGYAGPDKCGYKVCLYKDDGITKRYCNFATISITIAKQLEEVDIVNVDDRPSSSDDVATETDATFPPGWELDAVNEEKPITYIDPGLLFTDELWEEIDQSAESTSASLTEKAYEENWGYWNSITFTSNCEDDEVLLTIELQTDEHGGDVTWVLNREDKDSESYGELFRGPYGKYSYDKVELCVPSKSYWTFAIYDSYGDGLCDKSGCGYYKLYLNEREIVHVTRYAYGNSHNINVGYDPSSKMTQRDVEYLHAHNWRRKVWHESYNVSYVPLMWSEKLAEESKAWAIKLLDDCQSDGIEHEKNVPEGENLAKNKGLVEENGLGWGQLYPPEKIVSRWVDREVGWAYPDNAHLTQSLWRASKYMGCGESEKDYGGGKCRVQVCRYAKAGNCAMTKFNSTVGENWLVPMLKDSSACEPSCPPEGCY